jgi:hypothetical protein
MDKSELVQIIDYAVGKALREVGKDNPDEVKAVKEAVMNDTEVAAKIATSVKPEPKPPPPVPETFDRFRAFVRPMVTLMLSITFVFLIVSPFLKIPFLTDNVVKDWDRIFSAFMGVFGTIIGFWFGERTAMKVPGGEQAKEIAAAARKEAAKTSGEGAKK